MKTDILNVEDCRIMSEDFDAHFAKLLSKNPERIKAFKARVVKEYNETKDLAAFLEHLKVIAIAQKKTAMLAQKTKMKRPNIYRILSKNSNPSFANIAELSRNLGFDFFVKAVKAS
jgi:DNA-binding phage protein